jgi:hypothetical protein
MSRSKTVLFVILLALTSVSAANAQLPLHFSVNAGAALPLRNESDFLKTGYHLGAGLKVALIPLQADAAYDHMGGEGTNSSMTITSFGVSFPVSLTPGIVPVGVYVLAGGGMYHAKVSDCTATATISCGETKFGLNAGGGARIGLGISLFAEGRGHMVFTSDNKITYGTIGLGIRL